MQLQVLRLEEKARPALNSSWSVLEGITNEAENQLHSFLLPPLP